MMSDNTTTKNVRKAEALAADLAGTSVDPNEAQKALAYLRGKRDPKQYFDYLYAIKQNGSVIIRSRRTENYYRDLLAASERHLRGMDAEEMLQTLGWALRLLRYYRVVPEAAREKAEQAQSPQPPEGGTTAASRPTAPQIPGIGDTFTGPILDADESAVIIEISGFGVEEVTGVIKAEHMGTRSYRVGNAARVEVLSVRKLKSGRTIVELKPVQR